MDTVKTNLNVKDVLISILIIIIFDSMVLSLFSKKFDLNYFVTHLIQIIALLISILYFYFKNKYFIIFKNAVNIFHLYVIYSVVCCIIINFPYGVWFNTNQIHPKEYLVFIGSGIAGKVCLLIVMCILLPVFEEILFRGYIYSVLRSNYNLYFALALSALIFSIMHAKFSINTLIPGIIYALVYERTKNIWSSIIVHSFNNIVWFALVIVGSGGF